MLASHSVTCPARADVLDQKPKSPETSSAVVSAMVAWKAQDQRDSVGRRSVGRSKEKYARRCLGQMLCVWRAAGQGGVGVRRLVRGTQTRAALRPPATAPRGVGRASKSRLVWAQLRISFGAHRQCLALIRVGNPFRAQLRRNISELGKRAKPLPVDEREAAIHSCCTQPRTSTALNSMANKARAACARVARILKKFWRGDQDRWEPWPASYAVALPVQGEGEAAASLQVCVRR